MIDRLLIAGLGSIGRRHLRLLREILPNADIRVLRQSSVEENIFGVNGCFNQIGDAVAFSPQLAIISNPAPFHLDTANALVNVGAHLLVEKPISTSTKNVEQLIRVCDDKSLVLQVGYNLRFLDTLQKLRQEVQQAAIGEIYAIHHDTGQYLPDWRPGAEYQNSVSARADLGGGVLLELSHELDMLRWVFGDVSWMSGWVGRLGPLELDVEDSVLLNMGLEGGQVVQLSMDFLRRHPTRVCTVIGSEGSLKWDATEGKLTRFTPDTGQWKEVMSDNAARDASYKAQLIALLTAIREGKPNLVAASGRDGLAVLALVEAARRSADQSGRRIKIRRGEV